MDDQHLDTLLQTACPAVSTAEEVAAVEMARQIVGEQMERARRCLDGGRFRPAIAIPVAIGTLALVGAGTVAAYQLAMPPFQTLEPGLGRTTHAVPVDYRTDAGMRVLCKAFVEYRDVSKHQRDQVNTMVTTTHWAGYGQRVYDALPRMERAQANAPGPMSEPVMTDLTRRAVKAAREPPCTARKGRRSPADPSVAPTTRVGSMGVAEMTRLERLAQDLAPQLLAYFTRRVDPTADAADLLSETLLVMCRRSRDPPPQTTRRAFGPTGLPGVSWRATVAPHVGVAPSWTGFEARLSPPPPRTTKAPLQATSRRPWQTSTSSTRRSSGFSTGMASPKSMSQSCSGGQPALSAAATRAHAPNSRRSSWK